MLSIPWLLSLVECPLLWFTTPFIYPFISLTFQYCHFQPYQGYFGCIKGLFSSFTGNIVMICSQTLYTSYSKEVKQFEDMHQIYSWAVSTRTLRNVHYVSMYYNHTQGPDHFHTIKQTTCTDSSNCGQFFVFGEAPCASLTQTAPSSWHSFLPPQDWNGSWEWEVSKNCILVSCTLTCRWTTCSLIRQLWNKNQNRARFVR